MNFYIKNTVLLLFSLGIFCLKANSQNQQEKNLLNQKTKNLLVFYRTYVPIRLFYPDIVNINWDKYAVVGTEIALNSKDDRDLIDNLNKYFTPFFPTVHLSNNNIDTILKGSSNVFPYTLRIYYDGLTENNEAPNIHNNTNFFDESLLTVKNKKEEKDYGLDSLINNQYSDHIVDNIYLQFDIINYKEKNTLSNREKEKFKKDRTNIRNATNKVILDKVFYQEIGISNLLWIMGVVEHFYPYHEQIQTPYNDLVIKYLSKSTSLNTYSDFFLLYRQFISEINDGHADVLAGCFAPLKKPKIGIEYHNNQVIVCSSDENNISIGDTIIKIDDKPVLELLDSLKELYSGSKKWKIFRILNEELLYGSDTSFCNIVISKSKNEETYLLRRTVLDYRCSLPLEEELPNNGYYFNLTKYTRDSVDNIISALETKKYVIFDLRGYPIDDVEEFVFPLLTKETLYQPWFSTPQTTIDGSKYMFDTLAREVIIPNYVTNKVADVFFLSSEKAISYTESLLDIVSYYKLGTIVGTNTAGANGSYSTIRLPQHFLFTYTGQKAIRLNGELFHVNGISPDIKVDCHFSTNLLEDACIKKVFKQYE